MKPAAVHRLAITLLALAALIVILALTPLGEGLAYVLERARPIVEKHPVAGALVFVVLAIASATMAFVSSIALVPVAVSVWGPATAAALLWVGWFIGGNLTYTIGRRFGRPIVHKLVPEAKLAQYEHRISHGMPFIGALGLMVAMPSDVAGYLFRTLAYPRGRFVSALACAEVPYALGAAYLGEAAVEQKAWLLALLLPAAAVAYWGSAHSRTAQAA